MVIMRISQYTLKVVYYSFALCLFVWGVGWLTYEYTVISCYFGVQTFQNILLVCLGVVLSVVVWVGLSPKNENAIKNERVIHVEASPSGVVLSKDELEAKLFETEPNSKERQDILKQLSEMDKK